MANPARDGYQEFDNEPDLPGEVEVIIDFLF